MEQLPEPDWATELVEGDSAKGKELQKAVKDLEYYFGAEAGDIIPEQAKKIVGLAMLRKAERDNPHCDGNTRIVG